MRRQPRLKGGDITLTSGTAENAAPNGVGAGALTITATGAVLLGGVLASTGNITITAGTTTAGEEMPINFSTTQATTISGALFRSRLLAPLQAARQPQATKTLG